MKGMRSLERIWREAFRFVLFLVLWRALTGAGGWREGGWWFGIPMAALAAFAASRPGSGERVRLAAVPRFTLYFLKESVISGLDVTRRVLGPRLDIAPAFIEFPLTLTGARRRSFFTSVTNLLPGTLSVDSSEGILMVHVLDRRADARRKLTEMEERVERLFTADAGRGG